MSASATSTSPPLLEVDALHVEFPTRRGTVHAVAGVSFEVAPGEIVALVGESGCGKSATAHAILRLIGEPGRVASGRILFDGEDLLSASAARIREIRGNRIAMVFQEPMSSLNPVQRIGDQVAEPLLQHRLADRAGARARAAELLQRVNIPDPQARLDDYPHHFSGGMRQRVMIATALACAPRLVIADEPTTALDVTVQAQILELLRAAVQADGTGMLLITHNLGVVARYADRVNVMYGGEIVEAASADALYAAPRHPYTQGLLRSVPTLAQSYGERLVPIAGQPFDALARPAGCSFHPRCPQADARCRSEVPPVLEVGDGHRVVCWRVAEAVGAGGSGPNRAGAAGAASRASSPGTGPAC
jgi:oligopeptide/dipeptide ABC transporter ATP-binding protein